MTCSVRCGMQYCEQRWCGFRRRPSAIAAIDVFASLSTVATSNNYVKPQINEKGVIQIKGGRHPVVEKMMRDDMFVANDTYSGQRQEPHFHHHRTEHGR